MLRFNRIGVVGVGLIGASFALAVKQKGIADEVWGFSSTGSSSYRALELGVIDRKIEHLEELARECDLVMVASPVLSIPGILKEIAVSARRGAVVTDCGSVKNFTAEAHGFFKDRNFIGGHPIAGTEKSGPEAGFASLFEGSHCILTPVDGTDTAVLDRVRTLWEAVGMRVVTMSPDEHDYVMAAVSHMPHAVAFSLVDSVRRKNWQGGRVMDLAGGGFRDFTRIAKSDPVMWADIFLSNKGKVAGVIEDFEKSLAELKRLIKDGTKPEIQSFLESIKKSFKAKN